jgi:hypothetical protein
MIPSPAPAGVRERQESEEQLQAELQLSHVDSRAEAVDRSEGAGARKGNAGRVHRVAGERSVGVPEIRMVGEVEALKPELQVAALGEVEVLAPEPNDTSLRLLRASRETSSPSTMPTRPKLWRSQQVSLGSIHDGAGAKQVIQGAESGRWQSGWSSRGRGQICPGGGDVRAALIGQNQSEVQTPALVYASQDGERLTLKRMIRPVDGDMVRKVPVVRSVWRFPSTRSITSGWSGFSNTGSPISAGLVSIASPVSTSRHAGFCIPIRGSVSLRHDLRQEPYAVTLHVRIYAGGG